MAKLPKSELELLREKSLGAQWDWNLKALSDEDAALTKTHKVAIYKGLWDNLGICRNS